MSKYAHANEAIEQATKAGMREGWDKAEILLALIVSSISEYRKEAGTKAAHDAVSYELGELEGAVDTQFIRSR